MEFTLNERGEVVAKGPWPRTRQGAMQASVDKWAFIVQHGDKVKHDGGAATCALCHLYNHGWSHTAQGPDCKGCPVREYTGKPYCENTPYQAALSSPRRLQDWAPLELQFLKEVQRSLTR